MKRSGGGPAEEGVVEMGDGELLLRNVCWFFEEAGRREAVPDVCACKDKRAVGADKVVKKRCVDIEALFCGEGGVLKAASVREEVSSSALR